MQFTTMVDPATVMFKKQTFRSNILWLCHKKTLPDRGFFYGCGCLGDIRNISVCLTIKKNTIY